MFFSLYMSKRLINGMRHMLRKDSSLFHPTSTYDLLHWVPNITEMTKIALSCCWRVRGQWFRPVRVKMSKEKIVLHWVERKRGGGWHVTGVGGWWRANWVTWIAWRIGKIGFGPSRISRRIGSSYLYLDPAFCWSFHL